MGGKKNIIGVLHLAEFIKGYDMAAMNVIKTAALNDLLALQSGGIDLLIIENEFNGSISPYGEFLTNWQQEVMFEIVEFLKPNVTVPLGFCVLLNDYKTAFGLAKKFGAKFVRLDTFVDDVERISDGVKIYPNPGEILKYRKSINAEDVEIWADVHVKHTKLISKKNIKESAFDAISSGAAGVIITGNWTGQPPTIDDVLDVKKVIPNAKIIIGSGIDADNIKIYKDLADYFIIGSAFKNGNMVDSELVRSVVLANL